MANDLIWKILNARDGEHKNAHKIPDLKFE